MPNFDRLTRMANMIDREIGRGRFDYDMRGWGQNSVCCAIGMAVTTGEFLADGFVAGAEVHYVPVYRDDIGFTAIQRFFDIDRETAGYFFSSMTYGLNTQGPRAAAETVRRIRAFVNVESETKKISELIAESEARKAKVLESA